MRELQPLFSIHRPPSFWAAAADGLPQLLR
jgi:hypothetical protein